MSKRTALIAGGSGLVGGHLLQMLLDNDAWERVTSLGRTQLPLTHARLRQQTVDFDRLEEQREIFGADDVFCCLGTTIKKAGSQQAFRRVDHDYPLAIAKLAKQQGAKQFLVVTALGSDAGSPIFYNRVKGELERELRGLELPSLHVFQPSLLLGDRREHRAGERVGAVFMKLAGPAMVGPLRKYRAIEASVVARAMLRTALGAQEGVHVHPSDEIASAGA